MKTTDIWLHRCPDEGQWLAFFDGEGSPLNREQLGGHLRTCARCQALFEDIGNLVAWSDGALESVAPVRARRRRHVWWYPAAAAAFVAVAMGAGFQHVGHRAMAAIGSLFEVKSIATVPVAPQQLAALTRTITDGGRVTLTHYGTVTVAGPMQTQTVPLTKLSSAGIPNLWPSQLGIPAGASLETGIRVTLTLNVPHINQLIESQDGVDLFPASLNRQPFTLVVPAAATIRAGAWTLEEVPQPTVAVPGRVPVKAVMKALENLPFLPPSLETAVARMAHWQNTLVVPLPGHPENVAVAGTKGILDSNRKGTTVGEAWIKNGMVVAVTEHASHVINRTVFEREVSRLFS